jgi:glutamine amidotransferase-like protein/asparagine synthase
MAGFLIHQAARIQDVGDRLSRADDWFRREKRLPIVGRLEEARVSVVKYGRRCSRSADLVQTPDGWIASIGFWSHPRCSCSDDNLGLFKLLQERGPAVFGELDGMYAIAWYVRATGALTIATDHIGRLHVFYVSTGDGTFISSSCTALARAVPSDPDPIAIYEMLATGTIFEDRTPFRQIRRVPAGSVFEFRDGAPYRTTTTQSDLLGDSPLGSTSVAEVNDGLVNSVRQLVNGSNNTLSDLTGGLDSRLVLGLLLQLRQKVTVMVSGQRTDGDVRVARRLARSLGLNIEVAYPMSFRQLQWEDVLRTTALTEGGFDPIAYAPIGRLHSAHAKRYDLNLNGYGGELLRNVWWNGSHLHKARKDIVRERVQRFVRGAVAYPIVRPEFRFDLVRHFEGVVERCLYRISGESAYAKLEHLYLRLRMQCWLGSMTSATNQIWPAASPLMQRASLKAILRLDPELRLEAKAMHQMFAIGPRTLTTSPLATGFPPMAVSLRSWWRFAPGLMELPFVQWRRWRTVRRGPGGWDQASTALVRQLFASGAADYLNYQNMSLRFCLDRGEFERFHRVARNSGNVTQTFVGRLVALEAVYRGAAGR